MSGYVASARIVRVSPRLARPGRIAAVAERLPTVAAGETIELGSDRPPAAGPSLSERWDAARERWTQLTFFLCDAESWRT